MSDVNAGPGSSQLEQAGAENPSLIAEFLDFLAHNK